MFLCVTIDLIVSRCFTHGLLLYFILLHISNGSVSASLVGHVLYSADLMSAICILHLLFIVHRYIYSRYSSVFLTLYQLYHSLPSSTLILFLSLYLKLQPELLLKVVKRHQLTLQLGEQQTSRPAVSISQKLLLNV